MIKGEGEVGMLGQFLQSSCDKVGVDAQFCPALERLAFTVTASGEADLPEVWPEPLPVVLQVLTDYATVAEVYENLPDLELFLPVIGGKHD